MSGLFLTCSLVMLTGSVRSSQSGRRTEMGEINTFRLDSHEPASTVK